MRFTLHPSLVPGRVLRFTLHPSLVLVPGRVLRFTLHPSLVFFIVHVVAHRKWSAVVALSGKVGDQLISDMDKDDRALLHWSEYSGNVNKVMDTLAVADPYIYQKMPTVHLLEKYSPEQYYLMAQAPLPPAPADNRCRWQMAEKKKA